MTTTLIERATALGMAPEIIEAKIADVRASLPGLENIRGDLEWRVEQNPGDADAVANLAAARATLNAARDQLEGLGMSLSRAIEARDQATEASREKLRQSQRLERFHPDSPYPACLR